MIILSSTLFPALMALAKRQIILLENNPNSLSRDAQRLINSISKPSANDRHG